MTLLILLLILADVVSYMYKRLFLSCISIDAARNLYSVRCPTVSERLDPTDLRASCLPSCYASEAVYFAP